MPATLPPPTVPQGFTDTPASEPPDAAPVPKGDIAVDTKALELDPDMDLGQALEKAFAANAFKDDRAATTAKVVKESAPTPKEETSPKATKETVDASAAIEAAAQPISAEVTDEQLNTEIAKATKGMSAKATEAFKNLRYEHRDQHRKLKAMATLEAEVAALKAAPAKVDDSATQAVQKRVEELQGILAEKENALLGAKAEASDHYKAHYGEPLKAVEAALQGIFTEYTIDPYDVDRAMLLKGKEQDTALSDLAAEMPDSARKRFYDALTRRSEVLAARNGFLANAAENFKAQQAKEAESAQQSSAARKAEWTKAAESRWEEVAKTAPWLNPNGDVKMAEAIKTTKEFATPEVWNDLDVPQQAEALHRAAAWPLAIKQINDLQARLAAAQTTIAGYKGATPSSAAGAVKRTAQSDANGVPAEASFEEALNIRMAQASGRG